MSRKHDGQDKFNFKTYGVTTLLIHNYKTGIAQYLTNSKQPESDICMLIEIIIKIIKIIPDPFFCFLKNFK